MTQRFRYLFFIFLLAASWIHSEVVYLTWQGDPCTTMTIQWITSTKKHPAVQYRACDGEEWKIAYAKTYPLPNNSPYFLHRVVLTELKSDSTYTFKQSNSEQPYKFHTLPKTLSSPLRFVVGGDVYHDGIDLVKNMNTHVAQASPAFALVGGDLAYSIRGKLTFFERLFFRESFDRWKEWLETWSKTMVTPEGYLIPILPAVGNHEVYGGDGASKWDARFFYALFPSPGYHAVDFGNYMSILILDSGHTHPVEGRQTKWLEHTLKARQAVPNKFVIYHVGAYPSVRAFDSGIAKLLRDKWVPKFENYSVKAVFENHDHAYKRTYPIMKNQIDPKGVLYMGDGSWGVEKPREPQERWYLAKSAAKQHTILVTIDKEKIRYSAIDAEGNQFDGYDQK